MKFVHPISALVLTFGMANSAFAVTSTQELLNRCGSEATRESVLTELEKESGLNFNLESLSGNLELSQMVQEAQTRQFTKASSQALNHIRTILKITRQGVEQGKTESLKSFSANIKMINIIGDFFTAMTDIFTPVLDFTEAGLKAQAKGQSLPEIEVQVLMTDLEAKSNIYNSHLAALTEFQSGLESLTAKARDQVNSEMDQLVLNIHAQTCKAAVKEIRK